MQKFYVEVSETLARVVEVEAKDAAEAVERAENAYNDGEIVLTADDFFGDSTKFEQLPDYAPSGDEDKINTCDICLRPQDEDGRCSCTNDN